MTEDMTDQILPPTQNQSLDELIKTLSEIRLRSIWPNKIMRSLIAAEAKLKEKNFNIIQDIIDRPEEFKIILNKTIWAPVNQDALTQLFAFLSGENLIFKRLPPMPRIRHKKPEPEDAADQFNNIVPINEDKLILTNTTSLPELRNLLMTFHRRGTWVNKMIYTMGQSAAVLKQEGFHSIENIITRIPEFETIVCNVRAGNVAHRTIVDFLSFLSDSGIENVVIPPKNNRFKERE